jgi:hypothetical protein
MCGYEGTEIDKQRFRRLRENEFKSCPPVRSSGETRKRQRGRADIEVKIHAVNEIGKIANCEIEQEIIPREEHFQITMLHNNRLSDVLGNRTQAMKVTKCK